MEKQFKIDKKHIIALFLIVSVLVVYWPVQHYEFVSYDDYTYIKSNRHIQDGWTGKSIRWAFTSADYDSWQPMTWLSWMLDYELYGLDPGGYHRTNLLLHIANSLLLFFILSSMTGAVWRCGFVAALFALHPLHVESVAWIAERKDVLSIFFGMLTFLAYLHYVKDRSVARYLLLLILFILGLMSKPMLVTLPFVLLLLDYWPLGRFAKPADDGFDQEGSLPRQNGKTRETVLFLFLEKTPLLLFSIISSFVTYFTQQHYGAMAAAESWPLATRLANAIVAYLIYIEKIVWPWPLAVFYPHPGSQPVWAIALSLLLLTAISVYVFVRRRAYAYLFTGWFWYIGTLVPVIGIVQVGEQAIADRYTYLPSIGLFMLLAWGLYGFAKGSSPRTRISALLGSGMILVFMLLSRQQVPYWQNSAALFDHALQVTTDNYVAHNNFGNILLEQGKLDEALIHFRKAAALKPENARFHRNIGLVLLRQGKSGEAAEAFLKAIRLDPRYGQAYFSLGDVYFSQRRFMEAAEQYEKTLHWQPDHAEAHNNLSMILMQNGQTAAAVRHCAAAIRVKPDFAEAWNNMGVALAYQGQLPLAVEHFENALNLKPDYVGARNNRDAVLKKMHAAGASE